MKLKEDPAVMALLCILGGIFAVIIFIRFFFPELWFGYPQQGVMV